MEHQRYIEPLLSAYERGYRLRTGSGDAPRRHYFKEKAPQPRVLGINY